MDTTFVNGSTLTDSDWFNDLNRLMYTILGDPATLAAAMTALLAGIFTLKIAANMGATSYTVGPTDLALLNSQAGTTTVTLPAAASFPGRLLYFGNLSAQLVISNASNVIPIGSVAAGTAILAATQGIWCVLQSDGGSWRTLMT